MNKTQLKRHAPQARKAGLLQAWIEAKVLVSCWRSQIVQITLQVLDGKRKTGKCHIKVQKYYLN